MAEKKQQHDQIARTITELENKLAETPTAEDRHQRLAEIRDKGMEMLYHPDTMSANAWLRRHFIIYVKDYKVERIQMY